MLQRAGIFGSLASLLVCFRFSPWRKFIDRKMTVTCRSLGAMPLVLLGGVEYLLPLSLSPLVGRKHFSVTVYLSERAPQAST